MLTLRLSPPLSWRTAVPESPEMVPPIEIEGVVQVTVMLVMLVMLVEPTVPDPLVMCISLPRRIGQHGGVGEVWPADNNWCGERERSVAADG